MIGTEVRCCKVGKILSNTGEGGASEEKDAIVVGFGVVSRLVDDETSSLGPLSITCSGAYTL
jgi:hypothetical protein